MALNHNKLLPPIKTHASTILHTPKPASNSASALPILAIIVPTIFVTGFILITYLNLVTKCFSNLYLFHPLRWFFSLLTPQHEDQDPFIALSPRMWSQGLDESTISEIPTLQFTKGDVEKNQSVCGCVVCLTEFQDHDMLKVLPICKHAFHFHCIDVWLQTNANCPLCRSSIVSGNTQCPMDHIIAPSSSPQDSQLLSHVSSDEDFVVIEVGEMQQERSDSSERVVESRNECIIRKCHHVSIMGDECIDVRKKDERFCIQPIRRSFSMDSANDRQVCLDFQTTMQQNNRPLNQASDSEDCNSRDGISLFPFR
ncbi:RING-H2 finger protein ATL16-like [Vigna unguiculata]|uniref:RING-type E3 ubiquitin transferase n=1 Tax=Vigna unguiculata TaxID=3917 RepID=A0A4D6M8K9_VIGUN|nr:RING-H2 finger protein ATL16-like [Vigna unguiculata]QCD97732.1 nucleolysin TIA-1/TIAR [Vigna unguiculata]QCD97733.1 nucleolysin TIA-1/TIAR [Vigna unguiculata]